MNSTRVAMTIVNTLQNSRQSEGKLTKYKERPILMSTPMVVGTILNYKSQTRRTRGLEKINASPDGWEFECFCKITKGLPQYKMNKWGAMFLAPKNQWFDEKTPLRDFFVCPYGNVGDTLWVKETYGYDNKDYVDLYKQDKWRGTPDPRTAAVYYKASEDDTSIFPIKYWRPSIFMPRWASRLNLMIENIRVQRVQDISPYDVIEEGIIIDGINNDGTGWTPEREVLSVERYAQLWDHLNGKKYPWSLNPWIWVIYYRKLRLS